jgi:CHAD domain-containing protein
VTKLRTKAQKPLRRAREKLKRRGFKNQIRKLVRSVRWRPDRPEPNYVDFARAALRSSVTDFFATAATDLSTSEALHALRIAGKRLRYGMELYAGAFDQPFRTEVYPVFKDVQDRLGEINDHATAARLFGAWLKAVCDTALVTELDGLIERESTQVQDKKAQFCQWWTPARAAELRQSFDRFIAPQGTNGEAMCSTTGEAAETADDASHESQAVKTHI